MVYLGWLGSHPLTIGFKYAGQAWRTWRILRRELQAAGTEARTMDGDAGELRAAVVA